MWTQDSVSSGFQTTLKLGGKPENPNRTQNCHSGDSRAEYALSWGSAMIDQTVAKIDKGPPPVDERGLKKGSQLQLRKHDS